MLILIFIIILCCLVKSIADNSSRRVSIEEKRLKEEQKDKRENEEEKKLLKDADQTLNSLFELRELKETKIFSDEEISEKKQEIIYKLIHLVKEKKVIQMYTVLIRIKPLIEEGFLNE